MAHGTQGDQLVQIEVGPALGALDDVVDLKWAPAGPTGRAPEDDPPDRRPLHLSRCALAAAG
jgi:hypothetical protein